MTDDTATIRICIRCQQATTEAVVVGEARGAIGTGRTRYACPGCAPHYPQRADHEWEAQ